MRNRTLGIMLVIALTSFAAHADPGGPPSSATGSGHVLGIGGPLRTFAFSAITHKDGTVTGQAQIVRHDHDPNTTLHVAIDCLITFPALGGLAAVMSGWDTSASHGSPEGYYWTFAVVDQGEGSKAVGADFYSLASAAADPSIQRCDFFDTIAVSPISAGNVQVR